MAERLNVLYEKKPCYDIIFDTSFEGLWDELDLLKAGEKRLCIVTDSKVDELYGEELLTLLEERCKKVVKFVFPAGEESKNLDVVKLLYQFLIEEKFDISSTLI